MAPPTAAPPSVFHFGIQQEDRSAELPSYGAPLACAPPLPPWSGAGAASSSSFLGGANQFLFGEAAPQEPVGPRQHHPKAHSRAAGTPGSAVATAETAPPVTVAVAPAPQAPSVAKSPEIYWFGSMAEESANRRNSTSGDSTATATGAPSPGNEPSSSSAFGPGHNFNRDRRRQPGRRKKLSAPAAMAAAPVTKIPGADVAVPDDPLEEDDEEKQPPKEADFRHRDALLLLRAKEHLRCNQLAEAFHACIGALNGPEEVKTLLGDIWSASEVSTVELTRSYDEQRRDLTVQIMDAKDRLEAMKAQRRCEQNSALQAERQRRFDAEAIVARLRQDAQRREAEESRARKELVRLRNEVEQWRERAIIAEQHMVSGADLARSFAKMECKALRSCSSAEAKELKKKLLLKWHPDKQAAKANAELATSVMQEMQNRPEWLYQT